MSKALLFSSGLTVSYDNRFLRPAISMVQELASLCGANRKEEYHITVMFEEAAAFIINKYIDDKMAAHIEVKFMLYEDNTVVLELSDMGSPIRRTDAPVPDINDEDTLNGLWLRMIEEASDKFEIINRLNKGWLIRMEKKLKVSAFKQTTENDNTQEKAAGIPKLAVRAARPDDAADLVDLAFMTYRYSNAVPDFYDTDMLSEYISNGTYDIIVVTDGDKVIGASSTKYFAHDPRYAELGSAMIHPSYRHTRAVMYLIKEHNKQHIENPRNIEYFVTYLVTTHPRSQKGVGLLGNGYQPLSISMNMIPRPNYVGLNKAAGERESLLNAYHPCKELTVKDVYLPERHVEISRKLLDGISSDIEIHTENAKPSEEQTSIFCIELNTIWSAILSVNKMGQDWLVEIPKHLLNLISKGVKTVIVSLPSDIPLPAEMDEKLHGLGIIFCGFSLSSVNEIRLSYVYTCEHVDFSQIAVFHPLAKKLLEHIQELYKKYGVISS